MTPRRVESSLDHAQDTFARRISAYLSPFRLLFICRFAGHVSSKSYANPAALFQPEPHLASVAILSGQTKISLASSTGSECESHRQWCLNDRRSHDELERIGTGYFCRSEERKLSRRRTARFNADIYVCPANWFAGFIRNLGNNGRDLSRW